MNSSWINRLSGRLPRRPSLRRERKFSPGGSKHANLRVLEFERFEDRIMPTTITWTNAAGGAWGTTTNWNPTRLPTTGDDVVIPDLGAAGANLTITLSTITSTIQSLTSAENITLAGSTVLTVTGAASIAGALTNPDSTFSAGGGLSDLGGSPFRAG